MSLPALYADDELVHPMYLLTHHVGEHRLHFVWQECDQLLRQQWKQAVVTHYRDLAEPTLEKTRLAHQMQLLLPDLPVFQHCALSASTAYSEGSPAEKRLSPRVALAALGRLSTGVVGALRAVARSSLRSNSGLC